MGDRVEEVLSVWWTFDVQQPVTELIKHLRAAGVPSYLATNQDCYRAACMRDRAPYDEILDGSYYSCEIGSAKPSVEFFEHIASDLGTAPAELLFIDDQPTNIVGARSAGLNAECWTHRDGMETLARLLDSYAIHLDRAADERA